MSVEDKLIDSFNKEGGQSVDLFGHDNMPDEIEFFNFLQIAIADKVYGGSMDPEKGGEWRKGGDLTSFSGQPLKDLNLKDFVLSSGGQSKEAFASGLGIEEAIVDTVQYQDALNYEFIVGSKEAPNMKTVSSSGSSTGNPEVSIFSNIIDEYQTAFLKKEGGDDPFFSTDDERPEKYNKFMKMVTTKLEEGGVGEFFKDPFWKSAYKEYSAEFGSK